MAEAITSRPRNAASAACFFLKERTEVLALPMPLSKQGHRAAPEVFAALQQAAQNLRGPLVAFDTSTTVTTLVLVDPDHGVHERHWDAPDRPCVVLIEGLRTLAASLGRAIGEIRAIVVGLGPGSFTGLRVGLATAKGLSLGAQLPLYGASSLAMMAAEAGPGIVLALQDARRDELFAGLYRIDAKTGVQALVPDSACLPDSMQTAVTAYCQAQHIDLHSLIIVGHNAEIYAAAWGAQTAVARPRALWALAAQLDAIKDNAHIDPIALIPQYLRLSEPERQQLVRQAALSKP